MRAPTTPPLLSLLLLLLLPLSALAVFKDDAYITDWHLPLLGPARANSTFFHPPTPDSKATLIYTLSTRNILAAINPKDSSLLWRQDRSAHAAPAAPAIARPAANGRILTAVARNIAVFAADSGRLVYERDFDADIVDVRPLAGGGALAVFADGAIRSLRPDGETAWERGAREAAPSLHSVWVHGDRATVVAVKSAPEPQLLLEVMRAQGQGEMLQETLHVVPLAEGADVRVEAGRVLVWAEGGRTKMLAPEVEVPRPVEVRGGGEVVAGGETIVVGVKGEGGKGAEVWGVEGGRLTKRFGIEEREGEAGSVFSVASSAGKDYVLWTLSSGETLLYAAESPEVLKSYPVSGTLAGTHLANAVSEVLAKSNGDYAVRTFLTANSPGFEGDSHLIRNGEVAWTRKESLSSIVASTWLDLLDPATEQIVDELKVETHQNLVAAYVHRVKRHINELVTYGPAWLSALPQRLMHSFDGSQSVAEVTGKWRDFFGFRKFLIVVTAEGGLAALDVSKKGEIVWRATLRAPVEPAGTTEVPYTGISSIWTVRKGVVGVVLRSGHYDEWDGFEGTLVGQTTLGAPVTETAIIPAASGSGILALLTTGKVVALPHGTELTEPVYMVTSTANTVTGLRIAPDLSSTPIWTFTPPSGEHLHTLTSRPAHDPVASIGRVLGDRSVMYKYINPHLLLATTLSPSTSSASLYLLDAVSGVLLHSATHSPVATTLPLTATLSENFVVYTFFSPADASDPSSAHAHTLVVTELYESAHRNDRGDLGATAQTSSFRPAKPHALSQSWLVPARISALAVTKTKQGITAHNVLAYLPDLAGVFAIPKRVLDPRRPVNRDPDAAEREEGLARYAPVLEFDPRSMITHERAVVGVRAIVTSPAEVESTSLVVAYGGDVFGTREAPSMVFDMLGKGFGKGQLVVTVLALAVGCRWVEPMVRRKMIDQRWRA